MRRAPLPVAVALVMLLVEAAGVQTGRAAGLPVASQKLSVFRTCVLTTTPSASTAGTDSYVDQAAATTNNGSATFLDVQSGSSLNRRAYIRFDLTRCSPAIPSAASVKIATLRLYVSAIPAVCRTEDIFAATAEWTEAAITWNNQPFGTTINNPASGSRADALTVGSASCQNTTANAYVTGWTVTTDVQSWVAGSTTNNGWMIRDDVEGSATTRNARFSSKNANVAAQSPQLIVTYTI
jgi:hypothetical protein